jgi:hypothetical protein
VTSVAVAPDAITLGIVATNGGQNDIQLNPSDDLVLVDAAGNRYAVNPPPANPRVTVRKGTTLRGSLVFIGQLPAGTTSLTLITCDDYGSTDNQFASTPKFTIDGITVRP